MRRISVVLSLLFFLPLTAMADCKQDLRCLRARLAESSTALTAAEKETLRIMQAWTRNPTAATAIADFRKAAKTFARYREDECGFHGAIREGLDSPDDVAALKIQCEIALNQQRTQLLKELFPPLPVI